MHCEFVKSWCFYLISNSLQKWQESRNYRKDGSNVYGVCDGVGFSVAEEDGGKLAIFMIKGGDDAFTDLENVLASDSSELGQVQVGDVEGYLALFYDESRGQMPEYLLDELLSFVARTYRRCGFSVPNRCVTCGGQANKRAFHERMVQPMCASCNDKKRGVASRAPQPVARRDDSYDRGSSKSDPPDYKKPQKRPRSDVSFDKKEYDYNYASEGSLMNGILGAVLGGIAGNILFVITMLINFPLPALATASGSLAALGYIAFGGPRTKSKAVGTIIGWSVGLSVLFMVISFVFKEVKQIGSFSATMPRLFASFPVLFTVNVVLAIVGVILGAMLMEGKLAEYIGE